MICASKHSKIFIFLVLICSIICPVFIKSFKLSDPNALLPYNKGLPSNYTLEIIGASDSDCFNWKSSKPHIIRITPLFTENNCSKSAILSSVANLLEEEITVITVSKRSNGKKLYCEVYTDSVESIEFEYVTDKIFLGSSLKISLIARNKEGRKFNSISGLEVKYSVNIIDPLGTDVVKLTKFDASEYASPEENELEKRGLLSCSVLVESVHVGTAVISASLRGDPILKSEDLTLKVSPNVEIHPSSPLYLLRHAKVNVTLKKLRNEDENLEFTTDVGDSSIVSFDEVCKEICAKENGYTSLKIYNEDINLEMDVHVVKLARIGFRVSHGNYNILEELKVYEFFIDLFDEDGNHIFVSDNLRLDVKFPPKLFHIIYTSKNGSYFVVQTTAPGRAKVKAEFKGIIMEDDSIVKENSASGKFISASMTVTVSQRLNIFPPYTLLPVLNQNPMHRISLKASGGTGNQKWSLNNNEVAKITSVSDENSTIEVEIYNEIYDLTVTLTDLGNINFISKAKVSVQTPLDLEAYPSVAEAAVGSSIIVPVALLGYEDRERDIVRKFDDCSMIDEIKIVDPYVISYEKESYIPAFGKGCKSLSFQCKNAGHSRINIEYTDTSRNIQYKTTTVLACFKKLKPVYPVRISVLSLATSMEIAFDGGPRKWPLFKEGHLTELLPSNPEILKIHLIKDPVRYNKDLTVFRVECLALGENTLTFKIGNKPSATLPHPAKAEESIKLICAEPHSLHLKLFRKKSRQKLDDNIVKVPFYGEKSFEIDVYAKDKLGRKFANMSSLRLVWNVNDKTLAYPASEFDFESFENAVSGYRKLSRNFMKFTMRGGTGDFNVQAKITSYRKDILEKEGVTKYKELDREISTSIDLKLVSLRDLNGDLYDTGKEEKDEGYCENDSCKS